MASQIGKSSHVPFQNILPKNYPLFNQFQISAWGMNQVSTDSLQHIVAHVILFYLTLYIPNSLHFIMGAYILFWSRDILNVIPVQYRTNTTLSVFCSMIHIRKSKCFNRYKVSTTHNHHCMHLTLITTLFCNNLILKKRYVLLTLWYICIRYQW